MREVAHPGPKVAHPQAEVAHSELKVAHAQAKVAHEMKMSRINFETRAPPSQSRHPRSHHYQRIEQTSLSSY